MKQLLFEHLVWHRQRPGAKKTGLCLLEVGPFRETLMRDARGESEVELRRQLNQARVVGGGDSPKIRSHDVGDNAVRVELCMIKHIVELDAQFDLRAFGDHGVLEELKVPVVEPRTTK